MDTDGLVVLLAAASAGGLSAAARRLGITPMNATRRLAALERDLGVRLLHRTTRSMALTPEGEAFLPFAEAMLENETAGRARLRPATAGASGLLRVTAPLAFGRKIAAPLVPGLLRRHPELRVDLDLRDAITDLVAGGFDLAVRAAPLRDNRLIARRLADNTRLLCAAPEYLAERGAPRTLDDLAGHDCLARSGAGHWVFVTEGGERAVRLDPRFTTNSHDGLREACIAGGGLALLAWWNVHEELADGRLVRVPLDGAEPEPRWIWAVYPTARQVLPKVRVFIAALEEALPRFVPPLQRC
jgi:DNA-binding transcriptional LysR family regulator